MILVIASASFACLKQILKTENKFAKAVSYDRSIIAIKNSAMTKNVEKAVNYVGRIEAEKSLNYNGQ